MKVSSLGRTVLFSALAFATAAAVTVYVNKLSELDPFAGLRNRQDVMNPIDIQFKDVEMKHWKKGKLVTSGHIGRVDVHRDRQVYDLYNVTDGVYHTADSTFHYEGGHAIWYTAAERLNADGGVRVSGKNFDLTAPNFVYNAMTNIVEVPGPATGKLAGGITKVENVHYNISNEHFKAGPIHWEGLVAINYQQPEKSGPPSQGGKSDDNATRSWIIDSPDYETDKDNTDVTHYKNIRATDKVSIFTSPVGTYDRKKDVIICEGPVKYWGEKANLICDHLEIYQKEKRLVATGNVVMYLKPEDKQVLDDKMEVPPFRPVVPEEVSKDRPPPPILTDKHTKEANDELRKTDNVKKYPSTIRADKIVYWYKKGNRHAICTGSPQAQQEFPEGRWRMGWAHEADYDGEKDLLTLISSAKEKRDARMKNSIGDDGVAEKFILSTKDGDNYQHAFNFSGIFVSTDEDANSNAAKAAADKKGAGTTKPPSGLNGPIGH